MTSTTTAFRLSARVVVVEASTPRREAPEPRPEAQAEAFFLSNLESKRSK